MPKKPKMVKGTEDCFLVRGLVFRGEDITLNVKNMLSAQNIVMIMISVSKFEC